MNSAAVLLVNLGTPLSPKPKDVARYLREFLTDSRVIDIPWIQRQLLVRGIIVPSRHRKSALLYRDIWTNDGSPFLVNSQKMLYALQSELADEADVYLAMRYQYPSLEEVLEEIANKNHSHLIIVPLFPQYASATTGSILEKVLNKISHWNKIPNISCLSSFYADEGFIASWVARTCEFDLALYDHIIMSFHGLPVRQLKKADCAQHCQIKADCCHKIVSKNHNCYAAQCFSTANLIAEQLNLPQSKWSISFQSRLGKEKWIEPYTTDVISSLAKQGIKKILVLCPAFVCDCLETISEIGIEEKNSFYKLGGELLDLVPSLNDHPEWVKNFSYMLRKEIVKSISHPFIMQNV